MISTEQKTIQDVSEQEVVRIFELQSVNQFRIAGTSVKDRRAKLKKLHKVILKYRPRIKTALYQDYQKHPTEVDITEVYPVISELKHTIRSLGSYMSKQGVRTPFALLGSSSHIKYEPKGVVLIISPWNFPFNLTLGPLVSAIAAGNCVMLKPSEMTPHSSALLKEMISEVFNENEVALLQGGIPTSERLLAQPFNHIFFTGSPAIGKVVMTAAAKHLCSVTLELGGKSPTIVDETADVKMAARRIAWGKFINNGQICIAPDYVMVHQSKKAAFIKSFDKSLKEFYSTEVKNEASYARIVNGKHYARLKASIEEAVSQGARVEIGGISNDEENFIEPTIISNPPANSRIMKEEIFGPILPILEFNNLEEVLQEVNSREKPLALYIYSRSNKNIDMIINNTRAGGTCINHNGAHFYNTHLPFGGSNNSGIGKAHGIEGFKAFSNARGVFKQHVPNALELLVPPYNGFKQWLIDLTIKYF